MTSDRALQKPPGWLIFTLTVFSVGMLLYLYYDWVPGKGENLTDMDRLIYGAPLVLLLAGTGLAWAIRALHVVGQDRRWSWRIVDAPAVVIAALTVALLFPPPTFDDARPEFEAVAKQILADPAFKPHNFGIGGVEISSAYRGHDGGVYFTDADGGGLMSSHGWVYSPNAKPVGYDDFSSRNIGGPWYEYTAVWRD